MTLEGLTIIVIGGSSGIGLHVAKAAHRQGGRVSIVGRTKEKLVRAQRDIGDSVNAVAADLANEREIQNLFASLPVVHHLVVTAGEFWLRSIAETQREDINVLVSNRLWGTLVSIREAASRMPANGSITLTSGVLGWKPSHGAAAVAVSVSSIEALARVAALEYAPIRVNTVCPGLVDTPMLDALGPRKSEILGRAAAALPVKHIASPEEIAETYIHLMTSSFITGTVIHVDGGALFI